MTATPPIEPTDYLRQLFDDLELHRVVVAAHLGIADLVASRPLPVADLADPLQQVCISPGGTASE